MDTVIKDKVDKVFERFTKIGQVYSEILELSEEIAKLNPKNILEIGTGEGGTFFLWQLLGSGKIISIDLPNGPFGGIWYPKERNKSLEQDNSFFITGDSKDLRVKTELKRLLDGELLDVLFIDGDHSYGGIKHDYLYYKNYVKKGGIIAFHDIGDNDLNNKTDCQCRKFFLEIPGDKKVIDHQTNFPISPKDVPVGGIGWLLKK